MARIEILVEEPSMEECLRNLLPGIVPEHWKLDVNYFIRKHQGKGDLKNSIINKMKVFNHWHEPISVVILHDQDIADCRKIKHDIQQWCGDYRNPLLIRIVCRELESWYLGDLKAIEKAFPKFKSNKYENKANFKNPDNLHAKETLKKILPEYKEIQSSRVISQNLDIQKNRSTSFQQFIKGIQKIFI
ncbi:MAG: DUF4276 family protein [Leptospiraceae bacterium]|nr:DUF4276 family protein [Leptospiraceae bacterium]MCP5502039.1 DUF4276 family protein [Leptospiraceae bacterium]